MKLVFAIISSDNVDDVILELNKAGFKATKISTSGGFLKRKNVTLMIGIKDNEMTAVIDLIENVCHERRTFEVNMPTVYPNGIHTTSFTSIPQKIEVGGAIIFVVNVAHYVKI